MIALDLIFTESSICLRDFSGIYESQETDAFQTLENILQFEIVYKDFSTMILFKDLSIIMIPPSLLRLFIYYLYSYYHLTPKFSLFSKSTFHYYDEV